MSAYEAEEARIVNHHGETIETIDLYDLVTIELSLRETGEIELADRIARVMP